MRVFVVAAAAREIRLGLIICDLDGTLISSYMGTPNRRYNDWHVLPGRVEMLAALGEQGHRIAIATNQAGVAFGHVTESQARRKIAAALVALGLPDDTPIATRRRSPTVTGTGRSWVAANRAGRCSANSWMRPARTRMSCTSAIGRKIGRRRGMRASPSDGPASSFSTSTNLTLHQH